MYREDTADEVLVNTLHHGLGGYTGTSPSHPSSFASLYPAPPSNPPHNLSVQLELAPHSHLLSPLLLALLLTAMDFCLIYHSFSLPFSLSSPLFSCHPLSLSSSHPLLLSVFSREFVFSSSSFSEMELSVRCCPLTHPPSFPLCSRVAVNVCDTACAHVGMYTTV